MKLKQESSLERPSLGCPILPDIMILCNLDSQQRLSVWVVKQNPLQTLATICATVGVKSHMYNLTDFDTKTCPTGYNYRIDRLCMHSTATQKAQRFRRKVASYSVKPSSPSLIRPPLLPKNCGHIRERWYLLRGRSKYCNSSSGKGLWSH